MGKLSEKSASRRKLNIRTLERVTLKFSLLASESFSYQGSLLASWGWEVRGVVVVILLNITHPKLISLM